MKKWILKAIVQKTISYLPFSYRINYFFQKYITKGVDLSDEYFYDRLGHAQTHIESFRKHSGQAIPKTCLEIGTGWYPIVPISLFLSGADTIYSIDITFHTSKEKIKTTLEKIMDCQSFGKLNDLIPVIDDRMAALQDILNNYDALSLSEILKELNIIYLIEDARKISIADNSIDLINSNNTFEHIYPDLLKPILAELKRVISKKGGVMSHFIDLSDHFAHFDRSISIYNFLQFSDEQWKFIDNSIQPQSRLRIDDYYAIYRELDIPIHEETYRKGNVGELLQIKLDKKFLGKAPEISAISHCHFVSRFQ